MVSPNPSNGYFQLDFGQFVKDFQINITDIGGRIISSMSARREQIIFMDIHEMSGLYLVHITADGKRAVRQITIK